MSQYDQQQPAYQQPAYQPPQAYAPQQPTNPLALTAFICVFVAPASWLLALVPVIGTVLGFVAPVSAIMAVIFGHIALSQIKKRGGGGRGMALTAVILGYIMIGVSLIIFLVLFAVFGALVTGIGLTAM